MCFDHALRHQWFEQVLLKSIDLVPGCLQSASNVSLASLASGSKLGPVWAVLLLPRYQDTLTAARAALPALVREFERRWEGKEKGDSWEGRKEITQQGHLRANIA